MKRILCIVLLSALLLCFAPSTAEEVSEVMQVVKCNDYVSLREKPDTKSERLAKVHLGEYVIYCTEAENGFVHCTWDGKSGYILAQYLKTTPLWVAEDEILPNQMVYNCSEYVSLRKMPDTQSERLIKVPLGAAVTGCTRYNEEFIHCSYKGKSGYILAKYLKKADYSKVVTGPTPTPRPTGTPKVYPALPYYMEIINCQQSVSLRATASTGATVLVYVPLGAVVEDCVQVNDRFVKCIYKGQTGYILIDYLGEYEPPQNNSFDDLTLPAYEVFKNCGNEILEFKATNSYTVVVRRGYADNTEQIMAVCYDPFLSPVWTVRDEFHDPTELTMTNALVTYTDSNAVLVLFVCGKGFTAYNIGPDGSVQWQLNDEQAQSVGAGISYAVQADGVFYVIGYYSSVLTAISPDGRFLWECSCDDENIYWPYYIEPVNEGIYVYWDGGVESTDNTLVWRVLFSYDGRYVSTDLVKDPQLNQGLTQTY